MTTQLPLFDKKTAGEVRDNAIKRVGDNAQRAFMTCALISVKTVARIVPEFTTDEVVAHMVRAFPEVTTHEPRAWGAVMRQAVKEGWIANTHRVRASEMVSNHRRPKAIWASRILVER